MAEQSYDLVVIGGGPGGYVAAIRAGQLGLKVACIEKESKLGGTCLRVGCIPSKALLDASEKFAAARDHYADMGIVVGDLKLDLPAMMARKSKVVEQLSTGVNGLFKKNKVDRIAGTARLAGPGKIEVKTDGGTQTVSAKHIILATGSTPVDLPFLKADGKKVINSDHAIALEKVPGKMAVIGAGAIGLELGSVWSRLGSKVTVIEMMPQIVPGADEEMARQTEKVLKKQGLAFYTGAKVTGSKTDGGKQFVTFEWEGKTMQEEADVILVAVGRKPFTDGLGAKEAGVAFDQRGRIVVDDHFRTSVPNVYAIGDVIAGPMLAHKAEEEGIACVETIAGKHGHIDYNIIPGVVYISPELAWVGRTEEQCKADNIAYNVGKFAFRANGRALCMGESEGLVKVIADAKTDRLLGVHILGPQASSIISEAAGVMAFGGSSEDIARTCHAHPTLPEALKEACLAVEKRAIHS